MSNCKHFCIQHRSARFLPCLECFLHDENLHIFTLVKLRGTPTDEMVDMNFQLHIFISQVVSVKTHGGLFDHKATCIIYNWDKYHFHHTIQGESWLLKVGNCSGDRNSTGGSKGTPEMQEQ